MMMRSVSAILLLVAACGGGSGKLPDANGGGDGSAVDAPQADGPDVDAPPGMVIVHVRAASNGSPEANIRVLFANDDGTLAADRTTDATGTATAPLASGYVTVIHQDTSDSSVFELVTLQNVSAGDVLEFGPPPDPVKTGKATVTANLGGADSWAVSTPCFRSLDLIFGPSQSIDTFADPGCSNNVGILATFSKNGVVGFSHLSGQTIAANTPITMPAQVPALHTHVTLTGMPDNVRELFGVTERVPTDAGEFNDSANLVFVPPADFTADFARPPVGDTLRISGTFENTDSQFFGRQQVEVNAAAAAQVTLPVANLLQRWLFSARVLVQSGVPIGLEWASDGTPDAATIAWTRVVYSGAVAGSLFQVGWTILGPAPAAGLDGDLLFPKLPDPFFALTADNTVERLRLHLVGLDGTASYADVHRTLGADMFPILFAEQFDGALLFVDQLKGLFRNPGVTGIKLTDSH